MKNLYDLRVAKVIDEYDIILNAGVEDGVMDGMVFVIFAFGDEILDPTSKESLGFLEIVKGRVRVTHVQDRMCTARSSETYERQKQPHPFIGGPATTETLLRKLRDVELGDIARRIS